MLISAILVVGPGDPGSHWDSCGRAPGIETVAGNSIVCLELLGRSVLDRAIQTLQDTGIKLITVVANDAFSHLVTRVARQGVRVNLVAPSIDPWSAAECTARVHVEQGVEMVLLNRLSAYAEIDLVDLIRFHRERKLGLTSVTDGQAALPLFLVDAQRVARTRGAGLNGLMNAGDVPGTGSYSLSGYVNRLQDFHDLRRLIVDALLSHCAIRPSGREVKPGVWFGDSTQVHRDARVVAPAYVGSGAKVRAGALITRLSTLERGCDVSEGTVVEGASLLAHTYLGRGLNVSNAVVDGSKLIPLDRDIIVEIQDGRLLRRIQPSDAPHPSGAPNASLAERLLATAWS